MNAMRRCRSAGSSPAPLDTRPDWVGHITAGSTAVPRGRAASRHSAAVAAEVDRCVGGRLDSQDRRKHDGGSRSPATTRVSAGPVARKTPRSRTSPRAFPCTRQRHRGTRTACTRPCATASRQAPSLWQDGRGSTPSTLSPAEMARSSPRRFGCRCRRHPPPGSSTLPLSTQGRTLHRQSRRNYSRSGTNSRLHSSLIRSRWVRQYLRVLVHLVAARRTVRARLR